MTCTVRSLGTDDFGTLMRLEDELFGDDRHGVLGPYAVRLYCDIFGDTSFLASVDDEPVGYLLALIQGTQAYCSTLAIRPRFQGSRAALVLIRAFIASIVHRVDSCWFTVEPSNHAARALHVSLGAEEVDLRENYYGPGDTRIVSRIDADRFARLRARYERLGLVPTRDRDISISSPSS